MPIFDYHCTDCGRTYEVFHKVREKAEDIVCPNCGSRQFKKQMSAPMVSMGGTSAPESSCENSSSCGCSSGMCGLN